MSEARYPPSPRRLRRLRAQGIAPSAELALRWGRLGVFITWLWQAATAFSPFAHAIWACALGPTTASTLACAGSIAPDTLSTTALQTAPAFVVLAAMSMLSRWGAPTARRPTTGAAGFATLLLVCGAAVATLSGQITPGRALIAAAIVGLALIDVLADRFWLHRRARMTDRERLDEAREQAMSPEAREYIRRLTTPTSSRDSRPRRGPSRQ